MQLLAPAKINLSLQILRRREDGWHEIDTLMAPISLCDELTIEPDDAGLSFSSDDPALPVGEENLVVQAARAFFVELNEEPRVRITLRKKIPHGAGLGGGSSDAASTLLGLNQLHDGKVSTARLTSLAAALGSDVPFFLAPGAARCRGRGEIVEPVASFPQISLLLMKPEFGVASSWAYRQWQDSSELPGIDYGAQIVGRLTLQNDLERPVFARHLFLARMKEWLRQQPEVEAALMSGSGSTIFAVLREAASAEVLADRARTELDPRLWIQAARIVLASAD